MKITKNKKPRVFFTEMGLINCCFFHTFKDKEGSFQSVLSPLQHSSGVMVDGAPWEQALQTSHSIKKMHHLTAAVNCSQGGPNILKLLDHSPYFRTEGYFKLALGLGGKLGSAGSKILIRRCMRPIGLPFCIGIFLLRKLGY